LASWLCIGAVLALIAFWLVSRGRMYDRIFSDEHFLEVAEGMAAIKQEALAHIGQKLDPPNDPRVLQTSAGLAVFYTINGPSSHGFTHHVSVSIPGDYTAGGVGRRFTILAAIVLGLPLDRLALAFSRAGVHHASVVLSAADHEAICEGPLRAVSKDGVGALRAEVEAALEKLQWSTIGPPPH
jgi:hypothetical protein